MSLGGKARFDKDLAGCGQNNSLPFFGNFVLETALLRCGTECIAMILKSFRIFVKNYLFDYEGGVVPIH